MCSFIWPLGKRRSIALLWFALMPGVASAQTSSFGVPPGWSQRAVHDPSSSRYADLMPGGFARHHGGFSGGVTRASFISGFGPFTWGSGYFAPGYGYYGPGYWRAYGYPGWYYPPYYGPYGGGLVYAPLVIPAEQVYGPAAVWRMLDPIMAPASTVPPSINVVNVVRKPAPAPAVGQAAAAAQPGRKVRASNDQVRERAQRYVELGDRYFREQKYQDAYLRYRKASDIAGDVADSFFRQAQALVALGRYDDAARLLKRAISVDGDWLRWPVDLNTIYGPNQVAKAGHLEALAKTATQKPGDADLLFLVGAQLFLDGQKERSRKFFAHADERNIGSSEHLNAFLAQIPRRQPVALNDPANQQGRDL